MKKAFLAPFYFSKLLLTLARLVKDPNHLDYVFALNDQLRKLATDEDKRRILEHISRDPMTAQAMMSRPRIGSLNLHELSLLPATTLGGAYSRMMIEKGLSPESIPTVEPKDDFEYFLSHLYESHDLWHTVTGFDTDVPGELGLQAFYLAQFPGALSILLLAMGFLNALFSSKGKSAPQIMQSITLGWTMGLRAKPLIGLDWKSLLEQPLSGLRENLGIQLNPAPASAPLLSASLS